MQTDSVLEQRSLHSHDTEEDAGTVLLKSNHRTADAVSATPTTMVRFLKTENACGRGNAVQLFGSIWHKIVQSCTRDTNISPHYLHPMKTKHVTLQHLSLPTQTGSYSHESLSLTNTCKEMKTPLRALSVYRDGVPGRDMHW